uniref:Uncharacterized protein n=1 Tax=Aegilops tauschii subsp. strangulata TaxID=200361 RepID=A0A453AQR3_AEGTS
QEGENSGSTVSHSHSPLASFQKPPVRSFVRSFLRFAGGSRAMADASPQAERPRLRRLEFVHVVAVQAAVCIAALYALARDHSGSLRPRVDAVESAVRRVAGPVARRFHGVPLHVLAFVDRK